MLPFNLIAQKTLELNIGENAQDIGLPGADVVVQESAKASFAKIVGGLLGLSWLIAALLVLAFLVIGAIEWIGSGGDTSKIEKARNKMMQAVVGAIILAATLATFNLLQRFLGINEITFLGLGDSSSSGSGGSGGNLNYNCHCGNNAGYAQTGDYGRITYPNGDCYQCTSSGWHRRESMDDSSACPQILDCTVP